MDTTEKMFPGLRLKQARIAAHWHLDFDLADRWSQDRAQQLSQWLMTGLRNAELLLSMEDTAVMLRKLRATPIGPLNQS